MNIRRLEIFEAVMDARSLSAAARKLGISQAAVSKSLSVLEAEVGFILFRRVKGRIFPSSQAEFLLPYAIHLRNEAARVGEVVSELAEGRLGHVIVAAVPSISYSFLARAVSRFVHTHPRVRVEIIVQQTNNVAELVASNQADFGLLHQPTNNPYLLSEPICEAHSICLLPAEHPLVEREEIQPADLKNVTLIALPKESGAGKMLRRLLAEATVLKEPDIIVNQTMQAIQLVQCNAGVAIVDPYFLYRQEVTDVCIKPFTAEILNRLYIIRAGEKPRSLYASQLAQEILKEIDSCEQLHRRFSVS
ncbi:MAG: LysR family transcriptional regulator [Pusillimonas sp.]